MTAAEYYGQVVGLIGGVLLAVLSVGKIMSMVYKWIQFLTNLPQDLRNYFFKPKYLVLPTPDEIVKYSVKQYVYQPVSHNEMLEEYNFARNNFLGRHYDRMSARILMVIIVFSACYFAIGVKAVYYGLISMGTGN